MWNAPMASFPTVGCELAGSSQADRVADGRPSIGIVANSVSRAAGRALPILIAHARAAQEHCRGVRVYGLREGLHDIDRFRWAGITLSVFETLPSGAFRYAPKLLPALIQSDHDVIHLHGLWTYTSLAVSRWAGLTSKPTVISPHGMLDPQTLASSGWGKRIARALFEDANLRRAGCLHAFCAEEAHSLQAMGLKSPIAVIPNGVPLPSEIEPEPCAFDRDGRRLLLFLGRIEPDKGLVETIKAWSLLKKRAPAVAKEWVLGIAGWDGKCHEASLKRLASESQLEHDVQFMGPIYGTERDVVLRYAGAFILPSQSQQRPVEVLEAWAYAKPAFITRSCNLPEGFAAGAAFEIASNPELMAAELAARLGDTQSLAEAGRKARALAAARFSWSAVAKDLSLVYRWLVSGGPRPPSILTS